MGRLTLKSNPARPGSPLEREREAIMARYKPGARELFGAFQYLLWQARAEQGLPNEVPSRRRSAR